MPERRPYVPREPAPAPRSAGKPEPGLYAMRWNAKTPEMAARIRYERSLDPVTAKPVDRSWFWHGDINGKDDPDPSPQPTERVWRIWHSRHLRPIDQAEYDFLIRHRAWARSHAPTSPEAEPQRPANPNKTPLAI